MDDCCNTARAMRDIQIFDGDITVTLNLQTKSRIDAAIEQDPAVSGRLHVMLRELCPSIRRISIGIDRNEIDVQVTAFDDLRIPKLSALRLRMENAAEEVLRRSYKEFHDRQRANNAHNAT